MKHYFKLALAFSALVLVSLLLLLNKNKFNFQTNSNTSEEIVKFATDNENDGIYHDYDNNYKFEYPVDIFAYTDKSQPHRNEWINKRPPFSDEDSQSALFLYTKIFGNWKGDYSNIETTLYDKIAKLPEGSTFYDESGNTLGIILPTPSSKEPDLIYYFYKIPESYQMNKNYIYRAEWERNGKIYSVYMLSLSKEVLESNQQVFEEIISSFEFTN